ncbi:MAG: hypothetical protein JO187_05645 [Acidobacteria bacterium]|nr:hypothetical protein [Acidobacteriaceae bacterium]MBV9609022.1 hypothetical protein [Acidobacteriota bacterium]
MADAQSPTPDPFSRTTAESGSTMWIAAIVGVVVVGVMVGLLAWFGRSGQQSGRPPDPYLGNIKISDVKMAAAQNFVGGTVTYVEGKITNAGDKTVTGATTEVIFRNAMGQVVQKEDLPVRVLVYQGPDRDIMDLRSAPLKPGATADFRLTIEGSISADWNQGYPEVQVVSVSTA